MSSQARLLAAACASLPNLRRLDVKLLSPPPDDEPETGLEATLDALDAFPPCTGVALQLQPLRDAPPSAAPPFPTAPFRRLVARIAADGQPSRPPAASIVCMLAVWCRLTEENVTALADVRWATPSIMKKTLVFFSSSRLKHTLSQAAASAGHRSPLVALRLAGNVMSPLSSAALARAVRLCASLKELDVSHAVVARGDATAAPPGFYAPMFRAAAARAAGGAHVVLRTAPVLEA